MYVAILPLLFKLFLLIQTTTSALFSQCMNKGEIALSFEVDRYFNTIEVLDVLRKTQIQATFFYSDQSIWVPELIDKARLVNQNGHEVGILLADWIGTESRITKLGSYLDGMKYKFKFINHVNDKVLRPSNGIVSTALTRVTEHMKLNLIDSKLMISDWNTNSLPFINEIQGANPGDSSFILISKANKKVETSKLLDLINKAKEKGFKFVVIDECIGTKKESSVIINNSSNQVNRKSALWGSGPVGVRDFAKLGGFGVPKEEKLNDKNISKTSSISINKNQDSKIAEYIEKNIIIKGYNNQKKITAISGNV